MFDQATIAAVTAIATGIKVPVAALLAVAEVESNGATGAVVDGRMEPLIRWEGHYFYRLLPPARRDEAVRRKLAAPSAGQIPNPKGQPARYALLAKAKEIDAEIAIASCSWGLGQVMGANYADLGYGSPSQLADTCRRDVAGQVDVMARFIVRNGLVDELQRLDFAGFARVYNGPSYKQHGYDTKMRRAYDRRIAAGLPAVATRPLAEDPLTLAVGAAGPAVSALQEKLRKLGYYLHIDGDFGVATKKAVSDFQRDHGLGPDGVVGSRTWAAIEAGFTLAHR